MKIPHANNPEIERDFPSDAPSEWMNDMHEDFEHHWHEPPRKSGWQRLIIAVLCRCWHGYRSNRGGGAMTDELRQRAEDVQERIREWWDYDTGHLMSTSSDVIAALLARLEAVTQERDAACEELMAAQGQIADAQSAEARAEKAEVALAKALREREIGITEGDIVAYMNVASLRGELLATKAALADARRDADKLTNHLFHALPRWIDATADWDDGGEAAIAEMQELLHAISTTPPEAEPAPMTPVIARGVHEI